MRLAVPEGWEDLRAGAGVTDAVTGSGSATTWTMGMPGNTRPILRGTSRSSQRLAPRGSVDTMISSNCSPRFLRTSVGVDRVGVADLTGHVGPAGTVEARGSGVPLRRGPSRPPAWQDASVKDPHRVVHRDEQVDPALVAVHPAAHLLE